MRSREMEREREREYAIAHVCVCALKNALFIHLYSSQAMTKNMS